MLKKVLFVAMMSLCTVICSVNCFASEAYSRPNGIVVEGLGRGLLWSVQYDRMLNENFSLGIGFGTFSFSVLVPVSVSILPVYVNYYFTKTPSHFFVTAGSGMYFASSAATTFGLNLNTSGVGPHSIGLGYEYRGGFLFRATPMLLIVGASVVPFGGISVGSAF